MRGARTTHRASSCATSRATRAHLALLRHDTENNLRIGALTLSLARAERDPSAPQTLPKPVASLDVQSGVCEFANDHNFNLYLTCSSPLIEHDHEEGAFALGRAQMACHSHQTWDNGVAPGGKSQYFLCSIATASFLQRKFVFSKAGTLQHDALHFKVSNVAS